MDAEPDAVLIVVPAWIQAIASLVTVGAMVWLARLTRRYVEATDVIARESQRQVEELLAAGGRNQRALAGTVREEVKRIRSELGPAPGFEEFVVPHTGFVVPTVHRWLAPLIPQIGHTNAAVVGFFLRLERELHNYRLAARDVGRAQRQLVEKQEALAAVDGRQDLAEMAKWGEVSAAVAAAENDVISKNGRADVLVRVCHGTLDRIEEALDKVERAAADPLRDRSAGPG